jgi:hypothetical protein
MSAALNQTSRHNSRSHSSVIAQSRRVHGGVVSSAVLGFFFVSFFYFVDNIFFILPQ